MSEIPKDDPSTLNRSTSRSIVEGSALIELQASIRELEQERYALMENAKAMGNMRKCVNDLNEKAILSLQTELENRPAELNAGIIWSALQSATSLASQLQAELAAAKSRIADLEKQLTEALECRTLAVAGVWRDDKSPCGWTNRRAEKAERDLKLTRIQLQAQLQAVTQECSALREERSALSDRSSEQDLQRAQLQACNKTLRDALQRISDGTQDCQCEDHTNPDCCVFAKDFCCQFCIASAALTEEAQQ